MTKKVRERSSFNPNAEKRGGVVCSKIEDSVRTDTPATKLASKEAVKRLKRLVEVCPELKNNDSNQNNASNQPTKGRKVIVKITDSKIFALMALKGAVFTEEKGTFTVHHPEIKGLLAGGYSLSEALGDFLSAAETWCEVWLRVGNEVEIEINANKVVFVLKKRVFP
jgi:predicted RNase H-like HicB family nuclease